MNITREHSPQLTFAHSLLPQYQHDSCQHVMYNHLTGYGHVVQHRQLVGVLSVGARCGQRVADMFVEWSLAHTVTQ